MVLAPSVKSWNHWTANLLIRTYHNCYQSCSLHVIHAAFYTRVEATPWSIKKIVKVMWQIFSDSPEKKDIYIQETSLEEFSLRFVMFLLTNIIWCNSTATSEQGFFWTWLFFISCFKYINSAMLEFDETSTWWLQSSMCP